MDHNNGRVGNAKKPFSPLFRHRPHPSSLATTPKGWRWRRPSSLFGAPLSLPSPGPGATWSHSGGPSAGRAGRARPTPRPGRRWPGAASAGLHHHQASSLWRALAEFFLFTFNRFLINFLFLAKVVGYFNFLIC